MGNLWTLKCYVYSLCMTSNQIYASQLDGCLSVIYFILSHSTEVIVMVMKLSVVEWEGKKPSRSLLTRVVFPLIFLDPAKA